MRRLLIGLRAASLTAGCGGPGLFSVTGTVEGSYPCQSGGLCLRPLGIQPLRFESRESPGQALSTSSDSDGHFSIRLPAGDWNVYLGGGAVRAEQTIHVNGVPGERISAELSIPISIGAG